MLAYTSNYLDGITELLIIKKILSNEEIESIKNKAKERVEEKRRDFYEVRDIDK